MMANIDKNGSRIADTLPLSRNPTDYGVDADFRLTKFAELRGCGCKVPQETLFRFLEKINSDCSLDGRSVINNGATPSIGIGMDSSVTPIRGGSLFLIQTCDFFYPLVDDPYVMGKITCANVLSDLYAMGISECDNMLMILGISRQMTENERDYAVTLMMKGFQDLAREAETQVTGGQTVFNPWLTIGGTATTVCSKNEFIMPDNAIAGDVLVLTKPLGVNVAIHAYQWLNNPEKWNKIKSIVSVEDVVNAYQYAMEIMSRLNRTAAKLMRKYNAHGATDVTGFGLLRHAQNLCRVQKNEVAFAIHNIPVITKMQAISKACDNQFQLLQGYAPETSGGLLI